MNTIRLKLISGTKVKCKCGNLIIFKKRFPCTCKRCGRLVFPTKKDEFLYKVKSEMRKSK